MTNSGFRNIAFIMGGNKLALNSSCVMVLNKGWRLLKTWGWVLILLLMTNLTKSSKRLVVLANSSVQNWNTEPKTSPGKLGSKSLYTVKYLDTRVGSENWLARVDLNLFFIVWGTFSAPCITETSMAWTSTSFLASAPVKSLKKIYKWQNITELQIRHSCNALML